MVLLSDVISAMMAEVLRTTVWTLRPSAYVDLSSSAGDTTAIGAEVPSSSSAAVTKLLVDLLLTGFTGKISSDLVTNQANTRRLCFYEL